MSNILQVLIEDAYVHSNAENYGQRSAIYGQHSLRGAANAKARIEKTKQMLKDVIAAAEAKEKIFMRIGNQQYSPSDFKQWSERLFYGDSNDLSSHLRTAYIQTINNKTFQKALTDGSFIQINQNINEDLKTGFLNFMRGRNITDLTTVTNKVMTEVFPQKIKGKKANQTLEDIKNSTKRLRNPFKKAVAEKVKEKLLEESQNGDIKKIVENFLKSPNMFDLEVKNTPKPTFINCFVKHLKNLGEYSSQEATLYAEEVYAHTLGDASKFQQGLFSTIQAARGSLGEEGMAQLLNQRFVVKKTANGVSLDFSMDTESNLSFIPVGKLSEALVRSEQGLSDAKVNLKDQSKMSYSDFILRAPTGETTRVQSKNYQGTLHATGQKAWRNNGVDLWIELGVEGSLVDIFERLNSLGGEVGGEVDSFVESLNGIGYALANDIWFGVLGQPSIKVSTLEVLGKSGSPASGAVNFIETAIGELLFQALGISVANTLKDGTYQLVEDAQSSNLFFLISNRMIIPVSEILKRVLANFENLGYTGAAVPVDFSINLDKNAAVNLAVAKHNEYNNLTTYNPLSTKGSSEYVDKIRSLGTAAGENLIENARIRPRLKVNTQMLTSAFNI